MNALAMRTYVAVVTRFGDTRRGATAVEYGLLIAFVAGVCILAVTQLGGATLGLYESLFTATGPFQH